MRPSRQAAQVASALAVPGILFLLPLKSENYFPCAYSLSQTPKRKRQILSYPDWNLIPNTALCTTAQSMRIQHLISSITNSDDLLMIKSNTWQFLKWDGRGHSTSRSIFSSCHSNESFSAYKTNAKATSTHRHANAVESLKSPPAIQQLPTCKKPSSLFCNRGNLWSFYLTAHIRYFEVYQVRGAWYLLGRWKGRWGKKGRNWICFFLFCARRLLKVCVLQR